MRPRRALLTLAAALVIGAALPPVAAAASPAPSASPATVVSHGPRTVKVVALTFDDGHGTANCSAVVDILEATQTPATFFPNAVWAAGSPDFWHRVTALGFPVGNHTFHHPSLVGQPYPAQLDEITSDQSAMEAAMGAPMLPVFRPPYGAYDATTVRAATAAGYRYVLLWDVTFADSSKRRDGSPWPLASYIRSATRGRNGSIILGHCGDPVDRQVLEAVIASYRARGYGFVTIPQLLGMTGATAMSFPSPAPTDAASPVAGASPSGSSAGGPPPTTAAATSSSAGSNPSVPPASLEAQGSPQPAAAPDVGPMAVAGAVVLVPLAVLAWAAFALRRRSRRRDG